MGAVPRPGRLTAPAGHRDADLTWIKGAGPGPGEPSGLALEEDAMPVESLAVTVGVVAVFLLFSVVLAWAYRQTNGR